MKINVVDSIMGSGKSQFAIQMMNEVNDNNYIYITPYLDEVGRIKTNCSNREFFEPNECKENRIYSKSKSFKELMKHNKDIATTHSLFKLIDEEAEQMLEATSYTLILDEVMDVVQQIPIAKADIKILFNDIKALVVDENNTIIITEVGEEYLKSKGGKFSEFIHMAKLKRLFLFEDVVILWEFPVDVFKYFKEVYILTYLFDGQIQKYFFDFYNITYEKFIVLKNEQGYYLSEYNSEVDKERKNFLKNKIEIYEGKLNDIAESDTALSYNWYDKAKSMTKEMVSNNIYNYFKNLKQVKSNDCLWTCFKEHKIEVKSYKKAFIAHNIRATNEYSNTHTLAYAVNRYISPYLIKYFKSKEIEVNQDIYGLSEAIQWVWRARIRNNENISIYIPSKRIRNLFIKWLNNEI